MTAPMRNREARLLADEIFKPGQADIRVSDAIGRDIHIGPHDIFRHDPDWPPVHVDTPDRDVHVDDIDKTHRGIAVLMWHDGTVLGATTYDRDDRVRWVA